MNGTLPVAVLGLGNVLMGDDAAGPFVLARFAAEHEVPAGVELLDLGTPGPELAHIVEGRDALIVIDTLRQPGAEAGSLRLLSRGDLLRGPVPERLSPHDPSLSGALGAAELLGQAPRDVLFVGIVPKEARLGIGLTPEVSAAIPAAVAAVAAELARLGLTATRRAEPLVPDLWWER